MTSGPQTCRRPLFAMLCLVAVVLLYAPLGGAAWFVYAGACCYTGQCPIHGHPPSQTPSSPEHAMDCGHDQEMATRTSCSMSCCHNPDRAALTPVIFVLPAPFSVSTATNFEVLVSPPGSMNAFYSTEPLSPPPRISALPA